MARAPRFRRAGLADAAAIRSLTRAAYGPWVPLIGREPLPMVTDYDQAVASDLIDLLEQDTALLALIQMKVGADHLWLDNVAVHPDHQGRGLGHRLMAHAEATARDLGLPELRLLTNMAFAANLRFYEGLGFQETAREAFRGGVTVHYAKALQGPKRNR
jgi:GNAT superfamily N-acetyltransferase